MQRELIKSHLSNAKRPAEGHPRQIFLPWKQRTAMRNQTGTHSLRCTPFAHRPAGRQLLGKGTRNYGSGAHSALQIAFGQQLRVSIEHRKPGNAHLDGEDASGWNSLPRTEPAIQDGGAERVVDLPGKGLGSP